MTTPKLLLLAFLVWFVILVPWANAQDTHSASTSSVSYTLPHPGMLPGHPFYFLKEMRDGLTTFFTSRPVKKADFALLQADKYMQAAYLLASEKRDITIIVSSLTRSEEYFVEGLTDIALAKKEGVDTKDLSRQFRTANLKHQEVAAEIEEIVSEKDTKSVNREEKKIHALSKKIQK